MGLRFQRRIKVFPGLRLNLSRSGVGLSVGGRGGAHVGITARGQRYAYMGLPGTGVPGASMSGKRRQAAACARRASFAHRAMCTSHRWLCCW